MDDHAWHETGCCYCGTCDCHQRYLDHQARIKEAIQRAEQRMREQRAALEQALAIDGPTTIAVNI